MDLSKLWDKLGKKERRKGVSVYTYIDLDDTIILHSPDKRARLGTRSVSLEAIEALNMMHEELKARNIHLKLVIHSYKAHEKKFRDNNRLIHLLRDNGLKAEFAEPWRVERTLPNGEYKDRLGRHEANRSLYVRLDQDRRNIKKAWQWVGFDNEDFSGGLKRKFRDHLIVVNPQKGITIDDAKRALAFFPA